MAVIHELWRRLRVLAGGSRFDRDLEREMQFHLEMDIEARVAEGMNPERAREAARRQFGNLTALQETSRDAWRWGWLDRLGQDVRYAVRTLRRQALFTAVTLSVLALAIGANTAVFSAISGFLLRPLPFPEPDRLVVLGARHQGGGRGAHYRDFLDWRQRNSVFDEMAIVAGARATLSGVGEPTPIVGRTGTAGLRRVLRVEPVLGRFFTADEDRPGASPVLVLTYAAWQRRFGGDPDVLGRVMVLDGRPYGVVGVLPRGAVTADDEAVEFWRPLGANAAAPHGGQQYYKIMARLRPGVTLAQARANMNDIMRGLQREDPVNNRGWTVTVTPALDEARAGRTPAIAFALAIVVFVLVLACLNVAGLMLARASRRSQEMAVRASLGAGRLRLMRQLLTESLLLSLFAAAAGLVVARALLLVVVTTAPPRFDLGATLRLDPTVLLLTLGTAVVTGLMFGIAPAWYGARTRLNATMKGPVAAGGATRRHNRFLSTLVVAEIALALVLLVSGALLTRDLIGLVRTDAGVRTDHLLTFLLQLPRSGYPTGAARARFYHDLLERLRALPGVQATALVNTLPLGGYKFGGRFAIEGQPRPADSGMATALLYDSTPGYFRTVGIPLLRGREFDEHDTMSSPPVAIVDDALVRRCFAHQDPLGHRIVLEDGSRATIVGVVGSIKHDGPWYKGDAQIHFPFEQSRGSGMFVAVRSTGDPMAMASVVRSAVHGLDRDLPLERLRTMEEAFADTLALPRFVTSCLIAFAAFGLLLAAIGVYGVVAYAVSERTHEIGVRIALGASPGNVLALIVKKGAWLAVAGTAVGVSAARLMSRPIGWLLVDVRPHDPLVFTIVAAVLVAVALFASYLPARRATRVDPLVALRCE